MRFPPKLKKILVAVAVPFLVLSIIIKPILIPQNYLDYDQFFAKRYRGEHGGYPKENETIFVYGQLSIDPRFEKLFDYDPARNMTMISLHTDNEMDLWNFMNFYIQGNRTDMPLAPGDYVLLSTVWTTNSSRDMCWIMQRYDLAWEVIWAQWAFIISGVALIVIAIFLFGLEKQTGIKPQSRQKG